MPVTRFGIAGISAIPRSLLVPAAIVTLAVFAGLATAWVADRAGVRAVYYFAIFGLIGTAGMVAMTRTEPLRFVFLALVACLPFANALVPPGRFGVTVFDAVMVVLAIGLLGKNLIASDGAAEPLFPSRSFSVAWLLCVPCVVFSQFPALSVPVFVVTFGVYVFFLFSLSELRRERGFERLVLLLSVVLILMALALFVDQFLQVNLSLRGSNLNQLTYLAGLEIYRAGGFFQDPQSAGAFLACLITFLLVLSVRGRFRDSKLRFLVWTAIIAGLAALPTTISRGAMLSCLLVSTAAIFAFNTWSAHLKLAITAIVVVIAALLAQTPTELWLDVLPATVAERFLDLGDALERRIEIWLDTWDMFADQPLTGIGLGSFRAYLLETRPGIYNYYGIGMQTGVPYIPDQPESGYLTILYEGGILGSIAVLLVAGDAIRRGLSVAVSGYSTPDAKTECIAALAGLASFAVTFLTLFTMSEPRIAALFAFILAVFWYCSSSRPVAGPAD